MASIFDGSYIDNRVRVDAEKSANGRAYKNKTPDSNPLSEKQFNEVLADIEKPSLNSLQTQRYTTSPSISNLNNEERADFSHHLPPLLKDAHGDLFSGAMLSGKVELKVNKSQETVKELASINNVKSVQDSKVSSAAESINSHNPIKKVKNSRRYKANNHEEIKNIIKLAGKHHGVDPELSLAVAKAESSLRPHAISQDGHATKGLFQLLDTTGQDMLGKLGMKHKYDPFNPELNAFLGVGYLRRLHDIFSKETFLTSQLKTIPAKNADDLEKLAIAAFNAGEGNVASAQAKALKLGKDPTKFESVEPHLPASTRRYVMRVASLRSDMQRVQIA